MACANSSCLPKPPRAHRGQSTQAGEIMMEQHKNHTHSHTNTNPFRNDFQCNNNSRGYESGNHALIDNAERLGRASTEFTLTSYDVDALGTYSTCFSTLSSFVFCPIFQSILHHFFAYSFMKSNGRYCTQFFICDFTFGSYILFLRSSAYRILIILLL